MNNYGETTLARARLIGLHLTDWQDLLVSHSIEGSNKHFGSRIAFDGEFVYFSVGERGYRANAQDLSTHAGSIIRLNLDGSIPADNPFVNNNQALDEIWSYGHRNPQGLVWDDQEQRLWSIEHGPRGGDEINLIVKGKNYGWPVISYGKEYWLPLSVGEGTQKVGMEQPLKVYTPSIAPSSLLLYTGEAFPQWRGNLFALVLKSQQINCHAIEEMPHLCKVTNCWGQLRGYKL
jgi:glucose/arabinose dehydrogenase